MSSLLTELQLSFFPPSHIWLEYKGLNSAPLPLLILPTELWAEKGRDQQGIHWCHICGWSQSHQLNHPFHPHIYGTSALQGLSKREEAPKGVWRVSKAPSCTWSHLCHRAIIPNAAPRTKDNSLDLCSFQNALKCHTKASYTSGFQTFDDNLHKKYTLCHNPTYAHTHTHTFPRFSKHTYFCYLQ